MRNKWAKEPKTTRYSSKKDRSDGELSAIKYLLKKKVKIDDIIKKADYLQRDDDQHLFV